MGVISIAFAVALLLVVREELERRCESAEAGAFGALALSGVACSPWVGLAEGALVACVTSGVLVLSRALREESDRAFLAGSLLVALGALTKNEGTSFAIAVVVATLLVAPRRAARLLAVIVAVAAPWSIALRLNATSSELFEGSFTARVIERLSAPGEFVATLVEGQFDRAGFWLILGAVLVLVPATLRRERFILVVVALQSLAYLAIYAGTSHDFKSHVLGSLGRLSSQLAPLVAIVAIAGIVELLRSAPGGGRGMENEHE